MERRTRTPPQRLASSIEPATIYAEPSCAISPTPNSIAPKASTFNTAPDQSTLCATGANAGRTRNATNSVNPPNGTLTANNQGQPENDRMSHAANGPSMKAPPTTNVLRPNARPNRSGG